VKAVVFHGPGDLRYEEWPVPEPKDGELLVKVEAALTCGTDVKTFRRGHPVMIPTVPTVFGHELAGTVAARGRGVRRVREGDRVVPANSAPCGGCHFCLAGRHNLCDDLLFVNGAFGEYMALPARLVEKNLVPIGRALLPFRAAFAEPLACALLGVERGRVEAGQTVLIFGHGPLGCLLAMAVSLKKARVILVGKPGPRFDRVRALGLAECVESSAELRETLRELTGPQGVEVAIDATGRPEVWEQATTAVRKGGTVVFFGGCAPGTSIRLDTRRAHYEELTLIGSFHHTPEMIRRAVELLDAETIIPDGLISHNRPLAQVGEALELMARGDALKVLIHP